MSEMVSITQDTGMGTACLACGYQRNPTDQGPDWACPSCGRAYAKTFHEVHGSPSGHAPNFSPERGERRDEAPAYHVSQMGPISWAAMFGAIPISLFALLIDESSRHQGFLTSIELVMPCIALALIYLCRDELLLEMGEYASFVPCFCLLCMMMGVGILAITNSHVFDDAMVWRKGMMFAIPFLLACAAVVWRLNAEVSQRHLWLIGSLLILVASIYGSGVLALGNRWFDHGLPTVYPATVISKHVGAGKGGTYYTVTLAPWGPVTHSHDIAIRPADYGALRPGFSIICMATHPGAFGVAWGQQVTCDDPSSVAR